MIRFVHIQGTRGRVKTTTHGTLGRAIQHAQWVGGCIHKVYYDAKGLVRRMSRVGCYSGGQAYAGYSKKHRKTRRQARRAKRH